MSDTKPQRPKLELPTNIPVHVEIKYLPYNGEGKDYGYGLTYKYTVIHEGIEKTWFVPAAGGVYPQVKDFKPKDKIVITKKEEKNAEGKTYDKILVFPEAFDEQGRPSQALEPPKKPEQVHNERVGALVRAYEDVLSMETQLLEKGYRGDLFTPDVIQKLATTLFITETK